jgi:hypothetical protein
MATLKQTSLKKQTETIRKTMLEAFDVYQKARKEFAVFEGKMIDDSNFDKINECVANVQDSFADLWNVLQFVSTYAEFAKSTLVGHQELIDNLVKIGAKETDGN